MAKLSTIPHDHRPQKVMVYGLPKSGKTELVGRLAERYKLIWIDTENGWITLTKLSPQWQERIELIRLPDTRDWPIAIETLLKVFKGGPITICEQHGKVGCVVCSKNPDAPPPVALDLNAIDSDTIVVIDSLTQTANSAMAHITKGQPDDYKYDWEDYRKQGTIMDKLLGYIQQARYHVVCISHVTESELDNGKSKLVPMAGTTTFSRNSAKYFDHVIYCELTNKKHTFGSETTYSLQALTGSRTDIALEKMATGASLLPIFEGRVQSSSQEQQAAQKQEVTKVLQAGAVKPLIAPKIAIPGGGK